MRGWIYGRRLSACISMAPTGQMSVEFDAGDLGKSVEKIQIWLRQFT